MPLPKVLTGLFSGGASKIVDSVKGVISEFHLSPADKIKAEQDILDENNKHIKLM